MSSIVPSWGDTPAAALAQTERNQSVELLRIFGALGIVWFHMALPGAQLTYAALQVFVVLVIYFNAGRPLGLVAKRLMIPWAFWSLVFAAAKIMQATLEGRAVADEFLSWMLLTGAGLHLWFLPYTFAVLCLFAVFGRLLIPALGAVMIALFWLGEPIDIPFAQWCHVLPAAILGLAMAAFKDNMRVFMVAIPLAIALPLLNLSEGGWQFLIGTLISAAALALPLRGVPGIQAFARLSFGVYLIHPLMVAVIGVFGVTDYTPVHFLVVVAGSTLITLVLKRVLPQVV